MLATTAMLAEQLGIEPETIHKWAQRYSDFPPAKFRGVHDVAAVVAWCKRRGLPKKQGGSE